MRTQSPTRRPFLTAHWRYLLMLNYEFPPEILAPYIPAGTTLDLFQNRAIISIVGFRFLHTKLLNLPIPLHRNFDEINLRFYIRRTLPTGEVRRAVTFIKEIVPRRAIALTARLAYNEPYASHPMRSITPAEETDSPGRIEYSWLTKSKSNSHSKSDWAQFSATPLGLPTPAHPDSEHAFITEHYWGYTPQRNGTTVEYEVRHPPWKIWQTESPTLNKSAANFYGNPFTPILSQPPRSSLLALGSPISVHMPLRF